LNANATTLRRNRKPHREVGLSHHNILWISGSADPADRPGRAAAVAAVAADQASAGHHPAADRLAAGHLAVADQASGLDSDSSYFPLQHWFEAPSRSLAPHGKRQCVAVAFVPVHAPVQL